MLAKGARITEVAGPWPAHPRVVNVHERSIDGPLDVAGRHIDQLAGGPDTIWPVDRWPPLWFDGPLAAGTRAGHGMIRYTVTEYVAGQSISFRFTSPHGFDGGHRFEAFADPDGRSTLRHTIRMNVSLTGGLAWVAAIRPLHDALLEDALERAAGRRAGEGRLWSRRVRLTRWGLAHALRRTPARRAPRG